MDGSSSAPLFLLGPYACPLLPPLPVPVMVELFPSFPGPLVALAETTPLKVAVAEPVAEPAPVPTAEPEGIVPVPILVPAG